MILPWFVGFYKLFSPKMKGKNRTDFQVWLSKWKYRLIEGNRTTKTAYNYVSWFKHRVARKKYTKRKNTSLISHHVKMKEPLKCKTFPPKNLQSRSE